MTFNELSKLSNTHKIALLEIDSGETNDEWINIASGTYQKEFNPSYSGYPYWMIKHFEGVDWSSIGSVISDFRFLDQRESVQQVIDNPNSFYYSSGVLTIHLLSGDNPLLHDVICGVINGFVYGNSELSPNGKYIYNDIQYEQRIKSLPSITRSRDSNYFGRINFTGGNATLNNEDGKFDTWGISNNIYGQQVRIKIGFNDLDYDEFIQIYTGTIEEFTPDESIAQFSFVDERKKFSDTIPNNYFTLEDYEYLNEQNDGKAIPYIFGTVKKIPVVCTNEEETASTYNFKICDTTYHSINQITTIYNLTQDTTPTPTATSLSNATFSLSSSDYSPGDDIVIDCKGYDSGSGLISKGLDVITTLLEDIKFITYNSINYNTTDWATAQSNDFDIGYFIDEPTELYKIIEEISSTLFGNFILQGDGKYSFRIFDDDRTVTETITRDEFLNKVSIKQKPTEIVTNVRVGHSKDWNANKYQYINDDTLYNELSTRFQREKLKTYETLLINSTDASTLATRALSSLGGLFPTIPVKTKMQYIQSELYDMHNVYVNRNNKEMLGLKRCENESMNININNFETTINYRIRE